jgi:choline dehydrogenase-like flavoprotein
LGSSLDQQLSTAAEFERWEAMTPDEWERWYTEAEHMLRVMPAPATNSRRGASIRKCLQGILAQEGRTLCDLPFSGRVLASGDFYYNGPWDFLEAATPEVRSRIEIHSGMRVSRLRLEGSRVVGVDVEVAGKKSDAVNASAVFLAGGAMGIPRLLHASGIRPAALGRGISFHALLFGQMILDPDLCASASATDIAPRFWIPPKAESPWHLMLLRDTCPFPPAEDVENPHRLLEVQGFLSMEFHDENAIVINETEDLEFRFTLSKVDRERMRAMESDVQCLLGHLGRWRRGCESTWLPFDNAHMAGTCRMDRPDWEGVSNSLGKVHGFENLYLTSVGLFPVPVAENPTLTAVALALRTCDQFVT